MPYQLALKPYITLSHTHTRARTHTHTHAHTYTHTHIYTRRYNFLLGVPYQLERVIQFGTLLCVDSFLAVLTVMPCRVLIALLTLLKAAVWGRPKAQPSQAVSVCF